MAVSMTRNSPVVSSLCGAGRVLTCVLAVVLLGALSGEAALVSHWKADGDASDSAGSNTGFEQNGMGYATGKLGQAFTADGSDDYLWVPHNSSLDVSSGFTKYAWFNADTLTGTHAIFHQGYSSWSGGGRINYLRVTSGGNLSYSVQNGGVITGSTALSAGTWYHGVVTYSGGLGADNVKVYVDGAEDASASSVVTIKQNDKNRVVLGRWQHPAPNACCYFDGLIDDAALWGEALTGGEVKGLYDVGNDATLAYDAGQFDSLKQVHDAGSGSTPIGGLTWSYANGLGSTEGLSGGGANFTLVLDGSLGTGLITGPVPTNITWDNNGTGAWHTSSNWDSLVPNLNTQTAIFGGIISSPATVTVDAPVTVKGISFDNSNTYAIAGTSNVNLDADTGDAALDVLDGDHQFQVPVTLNDNTVVDIAAGSSLSFNHELNLGGNTLTKSGLGSLFINNQLTQGGGMVVGNGGVLGGSGTIGGDLTIGGILAPGKNSGILAANSSVVPEPTSLALIGLGFLKLIVMAGRRRN